MTDMILPQQPGTGRYDLRTFFRAVGHFSGERALNAQLVDRNELGTPAELIDEDIAKITAKPVEVAAFVDGIQASLLVTHRAHRPVYLNYVAAGAIGPKAKPIGLREKLTIMCSELDVEWVESLGTNIPVEELACDTPPDVEKTALQTLGGDREALERGLVEQLSEAHLGHIIVDGSLVGRTYDRRVSGVVKSTNRKYLEDESCLYRLPQDWRSPRFKIPAGSAGSGIDRYSAYVRLSDATNRAWNFGLIRVETFDPDLIDAVAAMCLRERQNAASGDGRYDRHLASIHACEEFMRARRPSVFRLR